MSEWLKYTHYTTFKKIKLDWARHYKQKWKLCNTDWEKMFMIHIICKRLNLEFINYFYKWLSAEGRRRQGESEGEREEGRRKREKGKKGRTDGEGMKKRKKKSSI